MKAAVVDLITAEERIEELAEILARGAGLLHVVRGDQRERCIGSAGAIGPASVAFRRARLANDHILHNFCAFIYNA